MFIAKKTKLFDNNSNYSASESTMRQPTPALREIEKINSEIENEGGSLKYSTTGSDFVDQFSSASSYKEPRSYQDISYDMNILWEQNPQLALKFVFYLRMITRKVQFMDGTKTESVQRGQGLKHEGIMRMIWIAINYPDVFWKNCSTWISIGSWKDIITMLNYDLVYNGWENRVLDWDLFKSLILAGLENPNSSNLLKKYLPQIKARSKCISVESQADTIIGKWITSFLFGSDIHGSNYKKYRKLKTSGTAHQWQQLISQRRYFEIDFNTIHGRALAQIVSSKFLEKHNLAAKYEAWIKTQDTAKYTGYVYELLAPIIGKHSDIESYKAFTIESQFNKLIDTAKADMNRNSSFITVLDTSSSMNAPACGTKYSSYKIAVSMAVYFGRLLQGKFQNAWLEFADNTSFQYFPQDNLIEKLIYFSNEAYGSTKFLSVADKFVDTLRKGVPESEFPTGILCISDGVFTSVNNNHKTNFKSFKKILLSGGFSTDFVDKFKVILWDIPNNYYSSGHIKPKFEDFADAPGLMHISGFDGSVVAFILGTKENSYQPNNSEELFLLAMNQEVLNRLVL